MELKRYEKITGIVLAGLLFVVTLGSTYFFLGDLKVNISQWVFINACSPVSYLYVILFVIFLIKRNLAAGLFVTFLPMFLFGTLSMFVMSWDAVNIPAHLGHIIMTLNMLWALSITIKNREYKSLATGLLISIIIFSAYVYEVISYNILHKEEIMMLFQ